MMITNPRLLGGINSPCHIFTRQLSTRRNPWELSRATPFFFKHLNAFVSDFSPTPPQKPVSSTLYMCVCAEGCNLFFFFDVCLFVCQYFFSFLLNMFMC